MTEKIIIIIFLLVISYYPVKDFFKEKRKEKNIQACYESQMYVDHAKTNGWHHKQILCLEAYNQGARFAE